MRKPARRSKMRVYCKRFKKVRGKRKCAAYSTRTTRTKKRFLKRSNKIRKANALYAKMTTAEKAAYLKKRLPGMEWAIDANPHLYGYRRRSRR